MTFYLLYFFDLACKFSVDTRIVENRHHARPSTRSTPRASIPPSCPHAELDALCAHAPALAWDPNPRARVPSFPRVHAHRSPSARPPRPLTCMLPPPSLCAHARLLDATQDIPSLSIPRPASLVRPRRLSTVTVPTPSPNLQPPFPLHLRSAPAHRASRISQHVKRRPRSR